MKKALIIVLSVLFLFMYSISVEVKPAIADCPIPVGHLDFCRNCGPCAEGQGDCDTNSECQSGLTCVQVTGTDYCQASGCPHPVGHLDYCRDCGPCAEGEGDCDTNSECQSGLTCVQVTGTDYCQSGGGCTLPAGHLDYCRDCGPCAEGEGDCDTNSECQSGLACIQVTGTDYCQSGGGCTLPAGHLDYCRDCGPCTEGEGDCDTNSECESGLTCVQVTGTDTCQSDSCSLPVGHIDYCRDCGPCGVGQGDCDYKSECQSGLTCVQVTGTDYCQPDEPPGKPYITSPAPGSKLTGSTVTFYWSANGVSVNAWVLQVGTSIGAYDIYASPTYHTNTYETVSGLPTDGSTVYVRLMYHESGGTSWQYVDVQYTAFGISNDDYSDHCGSAFDITSNVTPECYPAYGICYYHVTGRINVPGDRDWFSVKWPGDPMDLGSMTIWTVGETDTRGLLMSNDAGINCFGWEVEDDSSGSGYNFEITNQALHNQEYWIRVSHQDMSSMGGTGDYKLYVAINWVYF
jgi:hypothetical protein